MKFILIIYGLYFKILCCINMELKGDFNYCDETMCHSVKQVEIFEEVSTCTNDILIKFELNKEFHEGYLTKEGNIIEKTFLTKCYNSEIIFSRSRDYTIKKFERKILLEYRGS